MTHTSIALRNILAAGVACFAALIVAAPGMAQDEGSSSWFGGGTTAGSGRVVTQTRTVTDFQAITVSGSI